MIFIMWGIVGVKGSIELFIINGEFWGFVYRLVMVIEWRNSFVEYFGFFKFNSKGS